MPCFIHPVPHTLKNTSRKCDKVCHTSFLIFAIPDTVHILHTKSPLIAAFNFANADKIHMKTWKISAHHEVCDETETKLT